MSHQPLAVGVYVAAFALSFGTHLTPSAGSYDGSTPVALATDATPINTVSTIVARDGSGNFAAGTVTASIVVPAAGTLGLTGATVGGAPTWSSTQTLNTTGFAATLQTPRTIWGQSFDGSANVSGAISGATSIVASSTVTGSQFIGPLQKTLTFGTHLTGTSFNNSADVTIATDAASANTASTIVARDGSGNFTAGTITAALTGNASTASTLTTPRAITMTGDASWTVTFDGSAAVSAAGTLATVASAGTTGSSTAIPVITINAKGLTTSITTAAVVAPAGTLTGATLASNVVTSSLTTVGTIGTGVWQGTSISTTYTDAKIKTVTGTSNRLTIGGTSTDPTFDISTSYVGQTTITTLGTVATGTWQGTAVTTTYGGTGLASYTAGDLPYYASGTALSKLAIGTANYVLTSSGSAPQWSSSLTGISTTGNASTATALQNARTIGGVSFDGTANITVSTATSGFTVSGGNLALGTNSLTVTGSIASTGSRVTKGWFTDLEVTNAVVGSVTGNAATATALQTARNIGGVSFDGTASITVATATGGFTVSGGNLALGTNSFTLTGSIASTGSRVTKGWFTDLESTNAIVASITGSAPTLTTTRTIWGQNFNGSANVSGALSGATTIDASGVATLSGTTDSSSLTTGIAQIAGGVGIAKTLYAKTIVARPATADGIGGITIQQQNSGASVESALNVLHTTAGYGWRARAINSDGSFQLDVQNAGVWTTGVFNATTTTAQFAVATTFATDITQSAGTASLKAATVTTLAGTGAFSGFTTVNFTGDLGTTGARITKGWFTDLTVTNTITGSVSGSSGSATGNAATATALQNPRTIGGVSFDGTAAITVATATGGFTISGGDLALGANNLTLTGSIASTGSRVLKGWFTDMAVTNAISGSVTGSAATLTTPRAITMTGDASWTVTFDGSAAVSAAGTLATVASAGTTGSSTAIPVITINAKGLTTSITTAAVVAPAGTLTGATLASGVTASSLTSVGTLTSLTSSGLMTKSNAVATDTLFLTSSTTTTGANYQRFVNTGGTYEVGIENSGNSTWGAGAYDFTISVPNTRAFSAFMGGVGTLMRLTSTTAVFGSLALSGITTYVGSSTATALSFLGTGAGQTLNTTISADTTSYVNISINSAGQRAGFGVWDSGTNSGAAFMGSIANKNAAIIANNAIVATFAPGGATTWTGAHTGFTTITASDLIKYSVTSTGTTINAFAFVTTGDSGKGWFLGMDTTNRFAYWRQNDSDDYGWRFQKAGGTTVVSITNAGDVIMTAGKKLGLNGGTSDNYIYVTGGVLNLVGSGSVVDVTGTLRASVTVQLNSISTTVNAPNVVHGAGGSNDLKLSTSSRWNKWDVQPMKETEAVRVVLGTRPSWFRSSLPGDDPARVHPGLILEDFNQIDHRFSTGNTRRDSMFYDRLVMPAIVVLQNHERRIADLESWRTASLT